MKYTIDGYITPMSAAFLLVSDQIDLFSKWTKEQATDILMSIKKLSMTDLIRVIECTKNTLKIDSQNIPQFGSVESIARVPSVMVEEKENGLDYVQLGYLLKKDPDAKLSANQKYGENYGKVATQLGLINCVEKRFFLSPLTEAFALNFSDKEQLDIITRLFIRVPIIQVLIREAQKAPINAYTVMGDLGKSTMERRGSCIRNILKCFDRANEVEMSMILKNITWE